MSKVVIIILIIAVVLLAVVLALYFLGKKAEKKQAEQQEVMAANSQTMVLFIIDKKKLRLKDANLQKQKLIEEQTPWYAKRMKLPIVKARADTGVMSFICEDKVYETLLPSQKVKATISGLYITGARRIRGPIYEPPAKKGFFAKIKDKASSAVSSKNNDKKK